MKQYMLLFSLGPLQPFIEQARKTRDLWLGSFLMALLMEAAMEHIKQNNLIFPSNPVVKNHIPDLTNKYVAIFDSQQEACEAAQHSQELLEQCWQEICDDVWREIIEKHMHLWNRETERIWQRQTNPASLFEIFWIVKAGDPKQYKRWLKEAQQALDARKRLRDFKAQHEQGEKSTISGEREALHASGTERDDIRTFWYELAQTIPAKDISQDGTERLDAIDTVKRFAMCSNRLQKKNPIMDFPSTSSIATAPFIEKLITTTKPESRLMEVIETWIEATKKPFDQMSERTIPYLNTLAQGDRLLQQLLKRDGDCYFPETFTQQRLIKDYGFRQPSTQQNAQAEKQKKDLQSRIANGTKALKSLLQAASDCGIARPKPYYAILKMDGDGMGTLLGKVETQGDHRALSSALSRFAREKVPPIVEEQRPGRLVYAGGDDVLALIALEDFLSIADQLQSTYHQEVAPAVAEKWHSIVTASTGVVIAHHYMPLSAVLRAVRDAERAAKDLYGRNALVVTIMRRSGEQTRVGCRWRYKALGTDDAPGQPIQLFQRFYELFARDILSPKCIYTLLEEAPALIALKSTYQAAEDGYKDFSREALQEAQKSEVKRILGRHYSNTIKAEQIRKESEELAGYIVDLADAMNQAIAEDHQGQPIEQSAFLHDDTLRYGLVEVFGWLLVLTFLTRKEQD